MAKQGIGFDLSGEEALLLSGRKKGAAFQVTRFERLAHEERRVLGARAPLGAICTGLSGRDLILKYSRVPTVPDWQLAKLMEFEVEGIAQQAGGKLSYDYNLLPVQNEMTGEDTVLLALAKSDALDGLIAKAATAKGRVQAFTPNAIAAYNCFLQFGHISDEVTLIAWMGESSIDLALLRGASLLFARNVTGGLGVLDGAIRQSFNVREERARKIRRELLDLDPSKRGQHASSQEEKVAHAVQGVQGQLQAALRSTLAFCQSQIQIQDLSLDRVLLCGPGAKLRGLDRFLAQGLGSAVEIWDPVPGCELSQCPAEDAAALEEAGPESVLALGLALAPCFEDLYSIEILPEAVKKQRRFQERYVWNIAAALLAVAFLVFSFFKSQGRFEELQQAERVLRRQADTIKSRHQRTEKLIAGIEENSERIRKLEELAVPLHASIRTLRTLRTSLPENLWVTELRSQRGPISWEKPVKRSSRGRPRQLIRPYLSIEGLGVPLAGKTPRVSYTKFKTLLDGVLPMVESSAGSRDGAFRFTCKLDFLLRTPEKKTDKEEEGR
ncbi:MAG: hypothetical protein CSA62_10980 [Planctomycetota bacterium]|nr:MAG: hypothetical protein CSA62_10980 [Planctomycetota bacterium]